MITNLPCRLVWGLNVAFGTALFALIGAPCQAGVNYADPAGGWLYSYEGTFNPGVEDDDDCVGGTCPPGFGGDPDPPNPGDEVLALDGTYLHGQGDKWDGSAPGDPLSDPNAPVDPNNALTGNQGTSPGGAGAFVDLDGTTYIRMQDAGNPEQHGWVQGNLADPDGPDDPINTNRRVYFGHDLAQDGITGDAQRIHDLGVTLSFRLRIPNSGPLDDIYTLDGQTPVVLPWFDPASGTPGDYNGNSINDSADYGVWLSELGSTDPNSPADGSGPDVGVPDGVVDIHDYQYWKENIGAEAAKVGRGYPIHNEGRGMITLVQNDRLFFDSDSPIAFSLVSSVDVDLYCGEGGGSGSLCSGSGSGGLIMNNRVSTSRSAQIDSFDAGFLNILEIPDEELSEWQEFWITILADTSGGGTHRVEVYRNGALTPEIFHVTGSTAGNASYANENSAFLEFGVNDNDLFGSMDMDFVSIKEGIFVPTLANPATGSGTIPEPTSMLLIATSLLMLGWARRRSVS